MTTTLHDIETSLAEVREEIDKLGRLSAHQLRLALDAFEQRNMTLAESVVEKDDVADNLNLAVEEQCYELVATGRLTPDQLRFARTAVRVAQNLERIADSACHIAKRVRLLKADSVGPGAFAIDPLEEIALVSVEEGVNAFLRRDLHLAETACQREPQMDEHYVTLLMALRDRMQAEPASIPYLLHVYSVMKYLEKVGDYVLNVGEQAIFLVTGRRMKFEQYQQLDRLTATYAAGEVHFQPYWDGISGALVGQLEVGGRRYIYKEGSQRKIAAEVAMLEEWERLVQGVTPKVLGIASLSDREALLREFVQGTLLGDLLVSATPLAEKRERLAGLLGIIETVWSSTLKPQASAVRYVQEVRDRLDEVYVMHPDLRPAGGHGANIEALLARAEAKQAAMAAPFEVWLHGDFNVNNIIVDAATGREKFIDVHRSHLGDYLSDLAVFYVSLERQPRMSTQARSDITVLQLDVLAFGRRFGQEHGDTHHHEREKLALARSLLTSARVVMEPEHARALFAQGLAHLKEVAGSA